MEHRPAAIANVLRGQRVLRGWSQKQTVGELQRLAKAEGQNVGVNVQMLSNWESGRRQPGTLYRWLFAKLFNLPLAALGLSSGPTFVVVTHAPDMLGEWATDEGDEDMNRRAVFRHAAAIAGAAVVSPALKGVGVEPALRAVAGDSAARIDPDVVRGIEALTDRYRSLYYSVDPGGLFGPVRDHFRLSERLLAQVPSGSERDRLCISTATMALLAGRILFFDCSAPNQARSYYDLALEAAQEGGSDLLAAAALGHMSFISASGAKPRAAMELLAAANRLAERRRSPLAMGWLSAVEAELCAKAGGHGASLRALDLAMDRLQQSGSEPEPVWLDWFNPTRLDGFAGYTHLGLGRWVDAQSALSRALAAEPAGSKQRSVFLADLASTHLHQDELDQGCELGTEALEAAVHSGYATGLQRVRELRGMMTRWSSAPAVKQFTEQLAQVGA